ncbi:hypothetical protein BER2_3997 [plant metagenome]|uniref:Uncharacterized protein n=1 Tax=plant metagenome TaxID=1297885 RepID=A0A484RP51_9ZZZZ
MHDHSFIESSCHFPMPPILPTKSKPRTIHNQRLWTILHPPSCNYATSN